MNLSGIAEIIHHICKDRVGFIRNCRCARKILSGIADIMHHISIFRERKTCAISFWYSYGKSEKHYLTREFLNIFIRITKFTEILLQRCLVPKSAISYKFCDLNCGEAVEKLWSERERERERERGRERFVADNVLCVL